MLSALAYCWSVMVVDALSEETSQHQERPLTRHATGIRFGALLPACPMVRYASPASPCSFTASIRRRSVSAALLAVYAVTAAGVPLPGGVPPKQTNERYPCEHCQCGCRSAEQCWRSCCCRTLAERFEWARENNVRPPDYAIDAAMLAGMDLSWLGIKSGKSCVVACPACCSHSSDARRPGCCRSHASCCARASHSVLQPR